MNYLNALIGNLVVLTSLLHFALLLDWSYVVRVLLLTQVVVYPAHSGPGMKTLQVLRYLAARHEVIYCTYARSSEEVDNANELRKLCVRVETVPIGRSPLSDAFFLTASLVRHDSFLLRRDERAGMLAMVGRLLREERIDVVYVDQLNMMRSVPEGWNGPVILDEHNAVWQVVERLSTGAHNPFKRWFLRRESRLLRIQERRACQQARVVLSVSEHDEQALRSIAGDDVSIQIVPITVDAEQLARVPRAPTRPGRLLTIGTLFWPPNSEGLAWWLRGGCGYLRDLYPGVEHDIVGARPPPALQRLARRCPGVHLHGYVADARPFWSRAGILAVPLLSGGGVRVKILEAMAMGVPVVTTAIGCEGLEVRDGVHLLTADTPRTFAMACARVLQDKKLADLLTYNARCLVQKRYDAPLALQKLGYIVNLVGATALQHVSGLMNVANLVGSEHVECGGIIEDEYSVINVVEPA